MIFKIEQNLYICLESISMKSKACNLFIWINFLFFSLICGFQLVGQETKMGYSQIAKDLFKNNIDSVSYKNIYFVNDLPNRGSEVFVTNANYPPSPVKIYGGFKEYLKSLGIMKNSSGNFVSKINKVEFENCSFEDDLRFASMVFSGGLAFINCKFPNQSQDYHGAYGQSFGGSVMIDSCEISSLIFLDRETHPYRFFFKLNHSTISDYFQLELQKSTTEFEKTHIKANNIIQIHEESDLTINECNFNISYFEIGLYKIESIAIRNSTITHSKNEFIDLFLEAKQVDLTYNIIDANLNLNFTGGIINLVDNKINKKLILEIKSIDNSSIIHLPSLKNLNFGIAHNGK